MGPCVQLLVILMAACAVQATIVPAKFRKLDSGESITGKLGPELTVRSKLQCSDRCLSTQKCKACKYKGTGPGNCLLINKNTTAAEGDTFASGGNNVIYQKTCNQNTGLTWTPPHGWKGPEESRARFFVNLPDGTFHGYPSKPSGWTHVVLNFFGPNNGEGIEIYFNGAQVIRDKTNTTQSNSAGDGNTVVGRRWADRDRDYASVQVDELIFFNSALTKGEVELIFTSI